MANNGGYIQANIARRVREKERREGALALWKQGKTVPTIAAVMQRDPVTVRKYLKEAGVELQLGRRRSALKVPLEALEELRRHVQIANDAIAANPMRLNEAHLHVNLAEETLTKLLG